MNITRTNELRHHIIQYTVNYNNEQYSYSELYNLDSGKLITYSLVDEDGNEPFYKDNIIEVIHDYLNFEAVTLASIKDKSQHEPEIIPNT
jgi:hypothetical protein